MRSHALSVAQLLFILGGMDDFGIWHSVDREALKSMAIRKSPRMDRGMVGLSEA
jgi:hypothetical protein